MRILVIGGTRFMGPEVVRLLSAMGHDVTVFHRGQSSAAPQPGARQIIGDRHTWNEQAGELRGLKPDVVLDMIPFWEQEARDLVAMFKGVAQRVVAISSQDVYRSFGLLLGSESGAPVPTPMTESSPLREKLYPYRGETPRAPGDANGWRDDYDKILVERVIMGEPDLPGTVLRLPVVYGPRDRQHRLLPFVKRMADNRPAILLDEGTARMIWTRGYMENIASAIALAITDQRAAGKLYNLGDAQSFATVDWVRKIGDVMGWQGEVIVRPNDHLPAHLAVNSRTDQDFLFDCSAFRQDLDFQEPVGLDEALRRTIAWELATPSEGVNPAQFDYAAEDAVLSHPK